MTERRLFCFLLSIACLLTCIAQNPSCNICGKGNEVGDPDAIFQFGNFPPITCSFLQGFAKNGGLTEAYCLGIMTVVDVCECKSVTPAPFTPAPVSSAPVTLAPVTLVPVTPSPVTPSHVTPSPITPSPVTASPVTAAPVTAAPATPAPIISGDATFNSGIDGQKKDSVVTGAPVDSGEIGDTVGSFVGAGVMGDVVGLSVIASRVTGADVSEIVD